MKEMNFAIDVGNTHIVLGIYSTKKLKFSWRLSTDKAKTEDEYFSKIHTLFSSVSIGVGQISHAAISSVVPELTRVFTHLFEKFFRQASFEIVNAYSDLELEFPMEDPSFIGSDLIVNAYAAIKKYKTNCIICDFGTATTIQLIGKNGHFFGTVIAPGILTSTKNLFQSASQLSNISLHNPTKILGTTTEDALLSGVLTGNTFMIDGFIKRIKKEYGNELEDFKTIATGGISHLIAEQSTQIDVVDKHLTLDGLNLICEK